MGERQGGGGKEDGEQKEWNKVSLAKLLIGRFMSRLGASAEFCWE